MLDANIIKPIIKNNNPWMFHSSYDLQRKYNAKWGTKLTDEEFGNLIKAIQQSVKNKIKKENPELD